MGMCNAILRIRGNWRNPGIAVQGLAKYGESKGTTYEWQNINDASAKASMISESASSRANAENASNAAS